MKIYDALNQILNEWFKEKQNDFKQNPLAKFIRSEFPLIVEDIISHLGDFQIKGSAGAGKWADVPWVSILNSKISTTTQDGLYPVYLFASDGSGVYLSLNQGTTNPQNLLGKANAQKRSELIKEEVLGLLTNFTTWDNSKLNLLATTPLGLSYENPSILSKYYSRDNLPENSELESDLLELMQGYNKLESVWLESFADYGNDKKLENLILTKIKSIKTDISTGQEKLYKPCLILAAINSDENHFEKSAIKKEYSRVCQEFKQPEGTDFNNPYAGLVNDGIWQFTKDKSTTQFSDEDWKYIQENKEEIRQLIQNKWLLNKIESKSLNKDFPIKFKKSAGSQNLKLSEDLVTNFCCSILAKPFTILTGLSGSGKTQIARAFSKWLCESHDQLSVVAVGADWTSNENLLGYPDALNPGSYRKPDNGALDLILNAKKNEGKPYFLILDEMNLSHVERYFADFLSAIESGEAIQLHEDTGEDWGDVPHELKLPKNLFVIGTVNVDETTYMFSPKVLDRANVIEFRVSPQEMIEFLNSPRKPSIDELFTAGAEYGSSFVAEAGLKNILLENEMKSEVAKVLNELFPVLQKCGAEFGYRTAHEICRFVYFHQKFSDLSLQSAIDAAIMQKILPKLHGSRKKLGPVLDTLLSSFIESKEEKTVTYKFKVSAEKVERMKQRLLENGFTSFAEA